MKTGLIDVGGGTRGVYGAGVIDRLLDDGIDFDYCIGVSAGAGNLATYVAGQRGRNYAFYADYAFRKPYMSLKNFLETGSYIGLDYIYGELTNEGGENPLDYDAFSASPKEFVVVATDVETGLPRYFPKEKVRRNHYDVVKASCDVPVVNRPYVVEGRGYFDGGLSDPVPFRRAFEDGCDKVVIILTRPTTDHKVSRRNARLSRILGRHYPRCGEALKVRDDLYQNQVMQALNLQKEGKVLIVAPEDIGDMKTLTKDRQEIDALYRMGYDDAAKVAAFVDTPL